MQIPHDVRTGLMPTSKLRVALNYGNFLLVTKRAPTHGGVAPDLGREIARRLGAELEFVGYENAGLAADGAKNDEWDVAFIGAEPARAGDIAFTAAYVEIEATYLVPPGSPIQSIAEVDRPGVRIATAARAAYTLYLERTLEHASLVLAEGLPGSFELFAKDKLDVLAGLKPRLLKDAPRLPGARILEGRFTAIQQAMGTPKSRGAATAAWLRAFAEEAKSSGLVAELIARHAVQGLSVAPPATSD
ncbi:MAG: transporter substrate-binding domain-containing protein [Burkholderiales bacterium]